MTIKRVTIQLIGDDSQLKRVFDEIERRKKELQNNAKIKITADTAAAVLQIKELQRQLDELKRKQDEIKLKGLLGRLGNGPGGGSGNGTNNRGPFGSILNSINALISKIPVVGTALSQLSPAALPVIAAAVVAVSAALGSLLGGLTAATFGLGAFTALAIPDLKQISNGVKSVDAATTQLAKNKALKAIPAAFRPAVKNILDIKAAFDKMSKSLEPAVGRILGVATKIAKNLLPDLKPFAERAASAIDGLLKQFDKVSQSAGFKSFFNTMKEFTGPAITVIGKGLGQVLGALGDELKQLVTPKSLLYLKGTFTVLAGAIRLTGQALVTTINWAFSLASAFESVAAAGLMAAKQVGDGFLHAASTTLHAFSHIPGLGFLKGWAKSVDSWKSSFDNSMTSATNKVLQWQRNLQNAPKTFKLQADISNLQSRLQTAEDDLKNPNLTKTRRAQISADISNLRAQIGIAQGLLANINNSSATTYVNTVYLNSRGHAKGTMSAPPGWAWVGEQGPELMKFRGGEQVLSHARSIAKSLASIGSGGGPRHRHTMKPPHEVRRHVRKFRDEIMTPGGGAYHGGGSRIRTDRESGVQVHIHFNGVVTDPNAVAKKIQTMLLNLKQNRGGRDLGLA